MRIGDSVSLKSALYINKVGERIRWMSRMHGMKTMCMMAFLILSSAFFVACSESDGDDTDEFADWQSKNDAYFSNIYNKAKSDNSGKWKVLTNWSINDAVAKDVDHVVVEVLKTGTGSGCPLYTDSVRVHYRGQLIPSVNYPQGLMFNSSYTGDLDVETAVPTKFGVSNLRDGFATAVQYMHIGDFWRVYVPYQLGYGAAVQTNIPAYSTLIFHVYLDSYYHPGKVVPDWKAKEIGWIEE